MDFLHEREEVAYFMRRLYEKNLTTCSGGNISYRLNTDTICITPSGLDKGRIKPEQIGLVSLTGKNLTPELKPSIETGMHIAVYRKRPDIKAVVHAHPVTASSFTASEKTIDTALIAESAAIIGKPVYTPYALQGSKELAELVADAAFRGNTILMSNHGVLTVGESLLKAFDRIEVLEASAKITLYTELLGNKRELSESQLFELASAVSSAGDTEKRLVEIIAQAVLEKMGKMQVSD
ncbi:MAG: class II aldolase/adducin family protein [Spirochaetes bacterium]|nr:MAG: class II aldolase/adducin family protein [Spirochaetota bacterium]